MNAVSGRSPTGIPITEDEVRRFCDFFYRRTGIQFGAGKRYFLDRRLEERIAATGADSLRDYTARLRHDDPAGEEMQQVINALTVNETYFYRELYQLTALVSDMLPELVARRRGDAIRIWSLPCSTGEEPYSIALYLTENWPGLDEVDVEIIASDIDTRVLARARAGVFNARSVQHLSAAVLQRHFAPQGEGNWRIAPALRQAVRFTSANLCDAGEMSRHRGRYDVIFCRNLLIYFDDLSRRQAAEALYEALHPGGFVCLGSSESMSRMSSLFTVRKFRDAIVYQRSGT